MPYNQVLQSPLSLLAFWEGQCSTRPMAPVYTVCFLSIISAWNKSEAFWANKTWQQWRLSCQCQRNVSPAPCSVLSLPFPTCGAAVPLLPTCRKATCGLTASGQLQTTRPSCYVWQQLSSLPLLHNLKVLLNACPWSMGNLGFKDKSQQLNSKMRLTHKHKVCQKRQLGILNIFAQFWATNSEEKMRLLRFLLAIFYSCSFSSP